MRPVSVPPVISTGAAAARAPASNVATSAVAGRLGNVHNSAARWQPPNPPEAWASRAIAYGAMAELAEWERAGTAGELRAEAATRLRDAIANAETELDLSDLGLTDLPRLPGHVEELFVNFNRLTRLPQLPPGLTALNCGHNPDLRALPALPGSLRQLLCIGTGLTELPGLPPALATLWASDTPLRAVSHLPESLERLHLSRVPMQRLPPLPEGLRVLHAVECGIEDAPDAWPPQLRILGLRDNRLASVPALPMSLHECDLSGNRLTELPEGAVELPIRVGGLIAFDVTGNPLSVEASETLARLGEIVEAVYAQERAAAGSAPARRVVLPAVHAVREAAMAWYPPFDVDRRAATWEGVAKEAGAEAFSTFLDKLGESPWRNSAAFVADMRAWLDRLSGDADLRGTAFAIALDATETCEDGALYTLYAMRMAIVLADVEAGRLADDPGELVALGRGFHAFDVLTRLARGFVADRSEAQGPTRARREEIEVYLALVQKFAHLVPAVVRDATMRFEHIADLTPAHYATAERELRALEWDFPKFLCSWDPFQAALKRWDPARYEAVDETLREKLENGAFEDYQRQFGFKGMAAMDAMRLDELAPLAREYLQSRGVAADWLKAMTVTRF